MSWTTDPVARLLAGRMGHGIAGMRERAALHGGSVEAGPLPAGGFAVRARVPLYNGGAM